MKVNNFYNDHYDDYLEDEDENDFYEEEKQKAFLAKSRKGQNEKHKKTFKPRRQDQKQENQKIDYDVFLKCLKS